MRDWKREWVARVDSLFELWQLCEEAPERCARMLELLRESRALTYSAPDAEARDLAGQLLDEAWEAAHRLLYGDLERAREHAGRARHLRSRIADLARGPED